MGELPAANEAMKPTTSVLARRIFLSMRPSVKSGSLADMAMAVPMHPRRLPCDKRLESLNTVVD